MEAANLSSYQKPLFIYCTHHLFLKILQKVIEHIPGLIYFSLHRCEFPTIKKTKSNWRPFRAGLVACKSVILHENNDDVRVGVYVVQVNMLHEAGPTQIRIISKWTTLLRCLNINYL